MPAPSSQNDQEGLNYRLLTYSPTYKNLTVQRVKQMLNQFGPIMAAGDLTIILGPLPPEKHCISIVGYDDTRQVFKCLNSFGDRWNGDGYFDLPYDRFAQDIDWVRYLELRPHDRTLTSHAYSARIHLDMNDSSRNQLTVKVGVEGRTPVTVWDTPNRINCVDDSQTLCIDVPLPSYARDYWPPSHDARWYVEISSLGTSPSSKNTPDMTLQDITLARLYKKSDGSYASETYTAGSTGPRRFDGKPIKFYISPHIRNDVLTLDKPPSSVQKGQSVTLQGSLENLSIYDTSARGTVSQPLSGVTLSLYRTLDGRTTLLDRFATDDSGHFTYTFTPEYTADYQVKLLRQFGDMPEVIFASSDTFTISVKILNIKDTVQLIPQIPVYDIIKP